MQQGGLGSTHKASGNFVGNVVAGQASNTSQELPPCGELLATPVTVSAQTATTTTITIRMSTASTASKTGVAIGVYSHAGVSWSTWATSTAFNGPVYLLYAGQGRECAIGQSTSTLTKSERGLPEMHVGRSGQHASWGARFLRLNGKVIMAPACILDPVPFVLASVQMVG